MCGPRSASELGPKARVIGNVQYKLIEMSIGAEVNGKLIHESEAAATLVKPEPGPRSSPYVRQTSLENHHERARLGRPGAPLKFTDAAAHKVGELIKQEGNSSLKLRVYVQGGGCSGFQYGFTFDEETQEGDTAIENGGVTLLVDPDERAILHAARRSTTVRICRARSSSSAIRTPRPLAVADLRSRSERRSARCIGGSSSQRCPPTSPPKSWPRSISGSNSFHMVVARASHGQPSIVDRLREMVRLASGLNQHGYLDDASQERALACLRRFGQRFATCRRTRSASSARIRCAARAMRKISEPPQRKRSAIPSR